MKKKVYPTMFLIGGLLWVLLSGSVSFPGFIFGGIIGMVAFRVLSGLYDDPFFSSIDTLFHRLPAFFMYLGFFVKILVEANWDVFKRALAKGEPPVYPGIIRVNVRGRSPLEVTLIANTITLTPGTLTVDVSPDKRYLFVHCIDSRDVENIRKGIGEIERYVVRMLG